MACNVGALQGALYVNNSIILECVLSTLSLSHPQSSLITFGPSGPQHQGNFTNPHHNDPDEIAFLKQVAVADAQLVAVVSGCVSAVGDVLKYVGSVATVRDMVRLADMIDGVGKTVNFWGIRYVEFGRGDWKVLKSKGLGYKLREYHRRVLRQQ